MGGKKYVCVCVCLLYAYECVVRCWSQLGKKYNKNKRSDNNSQRAHTENKTLMLIMNIFELITDWLTSDIL